MSDTPPRIDLTPKDRKLLLALCKCAAGGSNRPALTAIQFRGGFAWATDSYILGRISLTEASLPPDVNVLVTQSVIMKALRKATTKSARVALVFGDQFVVEITTEDLCGEVVETVVCDFLDMKVPTLDSIWEEAAERARSGEAQSEGWFDIDNLSRLAALGDTGNSDRAIHVVTTDPMKPAMVVNGEGTHVGVVMPVRTSVMARKDDRKAAA